MDWVQVYMNGLLSQSKPPTSMVEMMKGFVLFVCYSLSEIGFKRDTRE